MFKAEYIFARILIPFLIGIGIFYFIATQRMILITEITLVVIFIFLLTINIIYKKAKGYKFKGITGSLIFIFFFILGGLLCLLNNHKLRQDYFAKKKYTYLKIWINDEPEQTNDILRFTANVVSGYENSSHVKLSGQLLLALKVDSLSPVKLKYGDELIVSAKYLEVEPPYNPAELILKGGWPAKTFTNKHLSTKSTCLKLIEILEIRL